MIAQGLMIASAVVLFSLGALHLLYTFFGSKLVPRDPDLQVRMAEVSPGITSDATMWSFWIGFNVSHSIAALLFGMIYGYLASRHPDLLFASPYLQLVGLLTLGGLLVVGKVFWFSTPTIGIALALAFFLAGLLARMA